MLQRYKKNLILHKKIKKNFTVAIAEFKMYFCHKK